MEIKYFNHEDNIAKILDRIVTMCKQNGFDEAAQKGEEALKKYIKTKGKKIDSNLKNTPLVLLR